MYELVLVCILYASLYAHTSSYILVAWILSIVVCMLVLASRYIMIEEYE